MDETKPFSQVEIRERLIQTLIIISSFFIAFSLDEFKPILMPFFSGFLLFSIVYYASLSRFDSNGLTDLSAILSSIFFTLLIIIFNRMHSTSPIILSGLNVNDLSDILFIVFFPLFLTFSLMSAYRLDWLKDKVKKT